MTHKVTTFMLRNPPASPQEGAAKKKSAEKKEVEGNEDGGEENGNTVRRVYLAFIARSSVSA